MSEESVKKGTNKKLIIGIVIIILLIAIASGAAYWYTQIKIPYDEAVVRYETIKKDISNANKKIDEGTKSAQALLDAGELPFDESDATALQISIANARESKIDVPKVPQKTNEVEDLIDKLKTPDYEPLLDDVAVKKENLENSIAKMKQITNPTGDFIIQRLSGIEGIGEIQGVTEDNDPNGKLNKQGGYTSTTYFSSPLINQADVYGDNVIDRGTEGGGAVEVYKTVSEAEARNTYLTGFDSAGAFSSGSHEVYGTLVIRTSDKLTATQQNELVDLIKAKLIELK